MTTHDAPTDTGEAVPLIEHFQWIRDNLPLDNLGHITSCSAFGDDCACATLARRMAARDAAQRADERERIAQAIEACMKPNGWVDSYRPGLATVARIARAGTAAGGDGR